MSELEIQFVLPACSDEPLDEMLRLITKAIDDRDRERTAHGFLGGMYGYGADWNSDVFEMRPYYWGDCDCGFDQLEDAWCASHKHSEECYQSELERELVAAGGIKKTYWVDRPKRYSYDQWRAVEDRVYDTLCTKHGKDRNFGAAVHCTCSYEREWEAFAKANGHKPTCTPELPNFLHRESGLEVRWYKYIGRGMETKNLPANLTQVFNDCLRDIASGMSASGQDPQGLEAKPASPTREAGDAQ